MHRDAVLKLAIHTLVACAVVVAMIVLWLLRLPILLFFLSLALSAALGPAIESGARAGPRWLALSLVYAAVVIVALVIPLGLATPLSAEIDALTGEISAAMEARSLPQDEVGVVQGWLMSALPYLEDIGKWLASGGTASAIWQLFGLTWGIFEFIANLLVVLILSLYWSADRAHFERLWLSLMSVENRARARELWRSIETELGAYGRSEAVQCLLAGVLLGAGYWLLGFPYPVLLAVIGAVVWLIPWAGPVLATLATFALTLPAIVRSGDLMIAIQALPAALYSLVVLGVLEYFVEPRLFDRNRFNSLLLLLMVIVFTELFGLTGLILGPPIAVTIQLVGAYVLRQRSQPASVPEESGWAAQLDNLWHLAEKRGDERPELINLLERLTDLVEDAYTVKHSG